MLCLAAPAEAVRFDVSSPCAFFRDCVGKVVRVGQRTALRLETACRGLPATEARLREGLKRHPQRDITQDPVAREFLLRHPIYLSLTTSPRRLRHIGQVLETLNLTHVTKIVLALPQKFGRDGATYGPLPSSVEALPNREILRPEVDWGPATKLLPAAEYARKQGAGGWVITIDDDIGYPAGAVNELILAAAYADQALPSGVAVGAVGLPASVFGLPWPQAEPPLPAALRRPSAGTHFRPVEILEGFAMVAYPADRVPIPLIQSFINCSRESRFSDDLVISFALHRVGVPRLQIASRYYHRHALVPYHYGLEADALHHGAGLELEHPWISDINGRKYRAAMASILGPQ